MMKQYSKQAALFIFCGGLTLTGCTGDFDSINTDPDNPTTVNPTNELAFVERAMCDELFDDWFDMAEPSSFGGQIAKYTYTDENWYNFRPGTQNDNWKYCYDLQNNLKDIYKQAESSGNSNMKNVATVLSMFIMQITTDRWRDVPYTEMARMDEGITAPAYDKQEDIYPHMLRDLKIAADGLADDNVGSLGEGDQLFSNKMTKWQQFCNSLRLRIAMRISSAMPDTAKTTVLEITGNPTRYPLIKSNSDNAFFYFNNEYFEPWGDAVRTRYDFCVSNVLVNTLDSLKDPRIGVYCMKAVNSDKYVGFRIGTKAYGVQKDYSGIGQRFCNSSTHYGFTPLFRACETYFQLAEAAKLGWDVGISAEEAYNNAVTLSLEENEVSSAEISTYLAGAAKYDGTAAQFYTQEWLALFKQGMEVWSLYRRTGIPANNYPAPEKDTRYPGHTVPPLRSPYPNNEVNLNPTNCAPYSAKIVDNFWGVAMMWDQRGILK